MNGESVAPYSYLGSCLDRAEWRRREPDELESLFSKPDTLLVLSSGERILFPPEVVERAIETAPESFTLYDRDGNPHAELGGYNVNFVPGSSGLKILDHRSGETRLADSTDFVEYVRLADGLEHIGYLATAFSTNEDIEPQVSDAWRLYLSLINSKRPVASGAFSEHGIPRLVKLLRMFRDSDAHLSEKLVVPGQWVRQGDVIALSGRNGRSSGAHLHYEMASGGAWVDPEEFMALVNDGNGDE